MELKDLQLQYFQVPKTGKIKKYNKLKENGRILFFPNSTVGNVKRKFLTKIWFNACMGGSKDYDLSDFGLEIFDKLPSNYLSIPAENFKFLIK